ncbi:MAG: hypothetical protein K1X29_00705 [Bdellovibrionales bacterium]|nr:hypothetical protein [Bdellovibrionales bacterium]
MKQEMRILQIQDLDLICQFEEAKSLKFQRGLETKTASPLPAQQDPLCLARIQMEWEMAKWTAPWRQEALRHYLPLGWSFGAFSEDVEGKKLSLQGYILAQPLLFFQTQTQTLWVEHVSGSSSYILKSLLETVVRWSRDKHLQRVLFSTANIFYDANREEWDDIIQTLNARLSVENLYEIKTTKMGQALRSHLENTSKQFLSKKD